MTHKLRLLFLAFTLSVAYAFGQTDANGNNAQNCQGHKDKFHGLHKNFSPQKYEQQKREFLIKEVQLTPAEANTILPLLMEQKKLQRENDKKIRELRQLPTENLDNNQVMKIIKDISNLKNNNLKIEQDYQTKMLKTISSSKYLLLIRADFQFDREMLHKIMVHPNKKDNPT